MGEKNNSFKLPIAWEQIYVELGPLLYNYGCKLTPQKSLVEDCIHDVFVNLLKQPQPSNTIINPKAYLFKSFRRLLINKLKADSQMHASLESSDHYQFDIELSSEAYQILEESNMAQKKMLDEAVQQLSPRQREAIYLKFYENHSYEEVASIMKLEKSALYTMIYKALSHLRKVLTPALSSRLFSF